MDFPTYVPAAARAEVARSINGDSRRPIGLKRALAMAESRLAEIEGAIETATGRGEVGELDSLRKQRAIVAAEHNELVGDLDCLQRLALDLRMREAYVLLAGEFDNDAQWENFIDAAYTARGDYAKIRDQLKRAAELRVEIARAADGLAKAIRQLAETGIEIPGEFYSIPELLRQADNYGVDGDHPNLARTCTAYLRPRTGKVVIVPEEGDAWKTAPHLPALLDTVANAARNFQPKVWGRAGVALTSRQQNTKTEYLRAFAFMLTVHGRPEYQIALTAPVMKAMAIVANVALNFPGVDVTYDDVRKALSNLHQELIKQADPSAFAKHLKQCGALLENSDRK